MAEIGIIASVIGVAGAGFRLSLILNAVGSEVASAGVDIHTISKGVTLFSLMLKQVGQHLQSPQSVHSSEALETAQQVTTECQAVFDEITNMLDKVQSRNSDGSRAGPNVAQRFKWCFKKARVQYLLAQLESLKLSLMIILQILQLGQIIMTPPRSEAKEDVAQKDDMVQQERAETQNIIIVRYWATTRIERLYQAAEKEDHEDRQAEIEAHNQPRLENGAPQLMLEAPPSPNSNALVKLGVISLGDLDHNLHRIRESPREMLQVSESVIDPLLNRWTRCHEISDQYSQHSQNSSRPTSSHKFTPSVDDLYEAEEERPKYKAYEPESPEDTQDKSYLLEGTTTNWREPHSEAARVQAAQLRRQYSGYQPSVEAENDDRNEDKVAKKAAPRRHVIDSSSSSDSETDSEYERSKAARRRRRRSSGSDHERSSKKEGPSRTTSYSSAYLDSPNLSKYSSSPGTQFSTPRGMGQNPMPLQNARLHPRHAATSPLPPLHTGNVQNPYQPAPAQGLYAPYPAQGYNPSRYLPAGQHLPAPQRPPSSDGKHRSPHRTSSNISFTEDDRRDQRHRQQSKNLRKSATRGLLGAGAVAGFLEALEGLSL